MINEELIESTWLECGARARPLRNLVFVRTEPLPEYIGKIYIPPSMRTNYSGMAHQVMLQAVVLATGPRCKIVKRGDRIAFARLYFARWQEMADKTLVGWVQEENIFGEVIDENVIETKDAATEAESGASGV